MKKEIKSLAVMAVCIIGALAASSCSKDEFFGLEDSEVLDYSIKTEIAMSQEYADYAIACFQMIESMNQPVDTTDMEFKGEIKGKKFYVKTDTTLSVMKYLDILKKAYPVMAKADKIDFKEIQGIALSKNKALKDIASKMEPLTKDYADRQSGHWLFSVAESFYGSSAGMSPWLNVNGCFLTAYDDYRLAISDIIWGSEFYNDNAVCGGLLFGDYSGVSLISSYEGWGIADCGSPCPEGDFVYAPNATFADLWISMGAGYWSSNRTHYVVDSEGWLHSIW